MSVAGLDMPSLRNDDDDRYDIDDDFYLSCDM